MLVQGGNIYPIAFASVDVRRLEARQAKDTVGTNNFRGYNNRSYSFYLPLDPKLQLQQQPTFWLRTT